MTATMIRAPLRGGLRPLVDATFGEAFRRQPILAVVGFGMLAAMLPSALAAILDPRMLQDVGVWVKPLKFQASVALYLLTMAWFWQALPPGFARTGLGRTIIWVAVACAVFEVAWITWCGAAGQPSHFATTPFGALMFNLMGFGALALTAMSPLLAFAIFRRGIPATNRSYRLAVVTGLVLTFALGATAGMTIGQNGGHWVGAGPAGASGLPIVGWSREVGDLRVAHFFGLHAMQVLPLVGWLAGRRGRPGTGILAVFAIAWVALFAWTLAEALQGRPFLPMIG